MKYLSVIAISAVLLAACATPEVAVEVEPEEESAVPEWYSSDLYASSDSSTVYGFAMASAADSASAASYSRESSIQNLKFEIDRLAEEARRVLADEHGSPFADTSFIIDLRNAIRDLDVNSAEFTVEHEEADTGVHYIYTKAVLNRTDLISLLQQANKPAALLQKLSP